MAQLTNLADRFRKLEKIGSGGMGEVYLGDDLILNRKVAIKTMGQGAKDTGEVKRFLEEARATGRLEHPGIPPVFELGKDEQGRPFFALRLVQGKTLDELIQALRSGDSATHDRFRFHHRLEVFLRICEAVAYAHEQGVIHRDIKPANVIVGEYGQVFLLDWGISYQEKEHHNLTGEFNLCGTPQYMAPELFQGCKAGPATDLYSLCATLYEWLTLEPAIPGERLEEVVGNVLRREPVEACKPSRPDQGRVPKEMSNLLRRGLAKQPGDRWKDLPELMDQVRMILDGFSCPVCPHTAIKSSMNWLARWIDNHPRLGIVMFFLLVVMAGLGWAGLVLAMVQNLS